MPVPPEYFAEGLALVDDRLIQLTWKEETAFVYGLADFEPQGRVLLQRRGLGALLRTARG